MAYGGNRHQNNRHGRARAECKHDLRVDRVSRFVSVDHKHQDEGHRQQHAADENFEQQITPCPHPAGLSCVGRIGLVLPISPDDQNRGDCQYARVRTRDQVELNFPRDPNHGAMVSLAQSASLVTEVTLNATHGRAGLVPMRRNVMISTAEMRISMTRQDRIVRDPQVCGGDPVFRGTRVTLRTVLASLAAGDSVDEILVDFPPLKPEDVQAAIEFAAASAGEDLPVPPTPQIGPQAPQSR